jgi:hypothetical protein
MSRRSLMFQRYVWLRALLTVGLCVRAHGQDCLWVDHHTGGPNGGSEYAMAYDSVRGVSVLFEDDTTWEWDGVTWLLRTTDGPSKRFGEAMTYDIARGVTVMFGGYGYGIGYLGDTWEWDGTTWTPRSTLGPTPRSYHKMAYDSVRGVTVLFGGGYYDDSNYVYHYFEDTWEWDGTTWAQRISAGPSPRLDHAMAYDNARGETVLFGGWKDDDYFGDTWAWDGESWTFKSNSGPTARASTAMAYDSARSATVLFGGWGDSFGPSDDTWEWDGTTWAERNVFGPRGRGEHAMAYDSHRGVTVLFGGYTLGPADGPMPLDDTFEWNGTSWTARFSTGPLPSTYIAMAYDSIRQATVLFTRQWYPDPRGETWEWRGTDWTLQSTTGPPPRSYHAMAYDRSRGVTVLFGGWNNTNGALGDTWEWDGASWTRRDGIGPSPRDSHAIAYDSVRDVTVLFGGWSDSVGALGDTWEWDGTTWTLRSTTGPSARYWHAMAYDSARGATVLFGGRHLYQPLGDTWEWDGAAWTLRSSAGPSPRYSHAIAYDTGRSVTVLYGGYAAGTETWEWDGFDWTVQSASAPFPREGHAMAYDGRRQITVLFGGSERADTWEYQCRCLSPFIPRAPFAEVYRECPGTCYAVKNRYLSFVPPSIPCGAGSVALRVTFGPMPNANNCPKVPDYSAFDGVQMWVGPEVLVDGTTPTGVYQLQSTPLFRDWTTVPSDIIQLSDCNIVPCATYTIEATSNVDYPSGPYSPPLVLTTTPVWGDIVGVSRHPGNGIVDALDVVAMVDRFKNLPGGPPRTWCDVDGNRPTQGVNLNIDALDITRVVDAFKGFDYPFSGPSAPGPCPGTP